MDTAFIIYSQDRYISPNLLPSDAMFQEQKYKGKYKLKSFEEYGRVVWGCDKCGQKFTGYKYLKIHKKEVHAY